jgi:hypothetical protein
MKRSAVLILHASFRLIYVAESKDTKHLSIELSFTLASVATDLMHNINVMSFQTNSPRSLPSFELVMILSPSVKCKSLLSK